jgi:hypothetical protein
MSEADSLPRASDLVDHCKRTHFEPTLGSCTCGIVMHQRPNSILVTPSYQRYCFAGEFLVLQVAT